MALILDGISIVSLKLLLTVNTFLSQVNDKTNSDTTILDNLALIIIIGDFYQFFLMFKRSLWTNPVISKTIHGKSI